MIISLYAGGMTVRDIGHRLARTLGTELSHDTISKITDSVLEEVKAWQARAGAATNPDDPRTGRRSLTTTPPGSGGRTAGIRPSRARPVPRQWSPGLRTEGSPPVDYRRPNAPSTWSAWSKV